MSTRHSIKGNPSTNAAARYSQAVAKYRAALEIWQRNGAIGPRPVAPTRPPELAAALESLTAAPEETPEEKARRQARESAQKQARMF